ncbi:FGGY-family carbohydrate kinase [Companilactobacillus mishanensis]|uniref:FGGY-family carbohydrate kinase n=1 Tax=Companilactobacillus mishanensis TaxID=2486008 RepID=UPI0015620E9D|nr:FGGY-family carbohydrate kinase [Companilactobacillus mishanensis]
METFLIIDIGTSSMRGIIFDKKGTSLYKKQLRYEPEYHKDGSVIQDAHVFYSHCLEICKDCENYAKSNGYEIKAISMTSQRSSLIPTKDGEPTDMTIMWQDTRVNKLVKKFTAYDDFFIERSGSRLNAVYLGAKIVWLKQNKPEIYEESNQMFNIPSYLIYHMTGESSTDTTYGSRTNLMNIRTLDWDDDLLKILNLDRDKLPKLVKPGEICGSITKEYAALCGIPAGTPVISAGGDQQCAAVGEGLLSNESVSINTGTGGYIIKNIDELPDSLTDKLIYNVSSVPNKYILEIDLLACSSILNWFIRNFYGDKNESYDKVNEDIKSCYDKNINVTALPYLKGKSVKVDDTRIRTAFTNIGLSTTKQDMLYSLMTSLFMEINDGINILRGYGPVSSVIIGGGLTNSKIMNQMQSDAYNLKIHKSAVTESTAIGALISVLVNQGVYESFDIAYENVVHGEEDYYCPNVQNMEYQDEFNGRKEELYDVLKGTKAGYYKVAKENINV